MAGAPKTDNPPMTPMDDASGPHTPDDTPDDTLHSATCWRDKGWTAQVIKNEDDDGWAVAMTRDGESEPALVGPWTMGRDKKNPKPLDTGAFNTLVKTASEVLRRAEQHLEATLHKQLWVETGAARWSIRLDITPDEDEPWATLSAEDEDGQRVAEVRVRPDFRFTRTSALAWIEGGFQRPR